MIATETRLRPYVELVKQKTAMEQKMKDTKARLAELEPQIVEDFQQAGTQSMNVDGYTVYLNRKMFAGPMDGDRESMCAALAGLDETWSFLVTPSVNANSLSARVRECESDETTGMPILPPELVGKIKVSEVFRVGARKSR